MRKFKLEFMYSQKNPVVRRIAFVMPPKLSDKLKSFKSQLVSGVDKLNSKILAKLNKISSYEIKAQRVALINTSPPIFKNDNLLDSILEQIDPKSDIRIIVNLHDPLQLKNKEILVQFEITHLFEIGTNSKHLKNNKENQVLFGRLSAKNENEVFNFIEDIMMDISMYHATIENRIEKIKFSIKSVFNEQKRNWLKNNGHNLSASENNSSAYICLSSYFRKGDEFDYEGYANAWKDLSNNFFLINNFKKIYPDFREQLKSHKSYGQLPIVNLEKKYDRLGSGKYLLVRTDHKPSNGSTMTAILALFKCKKWRNGRTLFVTFADRKKIEKYTSFLSIYPITKL